MPLSTAQIEQRRAAGRARAQSFTAAYQRRTQKLRLLILHHSEFANLANVIARLRTETGR